MNFPRISKAEIEDKSKGDAISKAAVILQTGWFVTQCIARSVQGLPITELELVTVAFAALNFMIYRGILWWDKPLHVQRGARVYKKRRTETVDDGDVEATVGFWDAFRDTLSSSDLPAAIVRGPFVDDHNSWLARVLAWPFVKPLYIMLSSGSDEEHERRVDTFYPAKWTTVPEFLKLSCGCNHGGIRRHSLPWMVVHFSL